MKSGLKRALSILLAIALMLPNFSIAIQAEEVGKAEVIQEANSRSQDAELSSRTVSSISCVFAISTFLVR